MVCFIPLQVQEYENCKSQIFHTDIRSYIKKMVQKIFCGSVIIFVVVPERSDCKFRMYLSQEIS